MIPIITLLPNAVEIRLQPETSFDRMVLKTLIAVGVVKDETQMAGKAAILRIPVEGAEMAAEDVPAHQPTVIPLSPEKR